MNAEEPARFDSCFPTHAQKRAWMGHPGCSVCQAVLRLRDRLLHACAGLALWIEFDLWGFLKY